MAAYIDDTEIRRAIAVMKPNGQLFEIRVIYSNKKVLSGYFQDADTLIRELKRQNLKDCNVYITLNVIDEACFDRRQSNILEAYTKATTSDNDIIGYHWLMIDLDPKRPADTSSTDEQIGLAKQLGNKIYKFLKMQGFNEPLLGFSGNGVHLLYKVLIEKTDDNVNLMKKTLETLSMLFSDNDVDVDVKNFNPARICKLYGTLAQKGTNSKIRPHRMSKIYKYPEKFEPTKIDYLKKLCELLPKQPETPQRYNNYNPSEFDLDDWLNKHGVGHKKTTWSGGTKYILDCCPFDNNHKGKDACIFRSSNGAIGFHCFHNSCADKTWRDVRLLYEPDAYEKKYQEQEYRKTHSFNRDYRPEPTHITQTDDKPVFLTAKDIFERPEPEETFIQTGTTLIDKKMTGLVKGGISLISGLRSAAKSTLLSQWALDAMDAGNNVGFCTLELKDKKFLKWMLLQAAGRGYTKQSLQNENYYYVPKERQKRIVDWIGQRLWVYNNEYGNNFNAIIEQFEKKIDSDKLDLLVLDNLMAFDIKELSESKWDAQTMFVLRLAELAKRKNVHIIFVAHPRKALGFLRLDDISGSADLSNAVDYAFIVHRNNNDFKRLTAQMFGWRENNEIYEGTNIIEVAKDRDGGTQDFFIPLWYETESKRLKNSLTENKIYGWNTDTDSGFVDVETEEERPPFL